MLFNFNTRKIFIISILAICIIAINLAVFFQITEKPEEQEEKEQTIIDTTMLTENFINIFDNQINYQKDEVNITKEDSKKELIYTSYINHEILDKAYELNVNIPYININSNVAKQINNEINSLFYKKALDVLSNTNNIIYTVKYKAYINDNILSLIIRADLKEGDNPQRLIIKTYNYNLSSNNELNINEVIKYRILSEKNVQSKINETIKNASENAQKYQELGYNKYLRDTNDKMYKLENTTVYFIGENKAIYIIYPYGNLNYTTEMDLLII